MKSKNFQSEIIIVLIGLLIFSGAVIIWNMVNNIFNEKITIYKNECKNETITEYYSFPNDFELIDCLNQFIDTPCYDNKNNIIVNLTCKKQNFFCYSPKNNSDIIFTQDTNLYSEAFTWYEKDNFQPYTSPENQVKGNITKEVCNKVKVDEVNFDCVNGIGDSIPCNLIPANIRIVYEVKDEEGLIHLTGIYYNETTGNYNSFYLRKILKKDITIQWLDENCECIKCEPLNIEKEWGWEAVKDGNKIIQCSKECSKYKCFSDYFMEVN